MNTAVEQRTVPRFLALSGAKQAESWHKLQAMFLYKGSPQRRGCETCGPRSFSRAPGSGRPASAHSQAKGDKGAELLVTNENLAQELDH